MKAIKLFLSMIIFLIIISTISLISLNNNINEKEIIKNEFKGNVIKFEISQNENYIPNIDREYPDRYNDKIWEYYDRKTDSRDRTFFR